MIALLIDALIAYTLAGEKLCWWPLASIAGGFAGALGARALTGAMSGEWSRPDQAIVSGVVHAIICTVACLLLRRRKSA